MTSKTEQCLADKNDPVDRLQRKITRMKTLLAGYKHNRSIQHAMLQLSELASTVTDMTVFYTAIHGVVDQLLRAENFYVVLVDPQSGRFTPVYFADQTDASEIDDLPSESFRDGLTGYVYRTGQSLLCDPKQVEKMARRGDIIAYGEVPSHWMGGPLLRDQQPIGVVAVQTYDNTRYSQTDQALLEFISLHLVTAIDRIKQRELLELRVRNRTQELSLLNQNLQDEVRERERAEDLQSALFKISQITATEVLMDDFYQAIHQVLKTLMYAQNCYIALLCNEDRQLRFPFYVDAKNTRVKSRRLGRGLTEHVITKGEACLISPQDAQRLADDGLINRRYTDRGDYGEISTSWLGAPLIINDKVIGVITTQAYENDHRYCNKDLDVLRFVSHHLAVAIQRKQAGDDLRHSHDELENQVQTRTQELRQSNNSLKLQIEERKKAEEKLYFEANHDALTGLPNRKLLLLQLESAIKEGRGGSMGCGDFAVLFIDLDRFKLINDTLGHHAGDEFLIEVSLRIGNCIREQDILARLGGDEFVILLRQIHTLDDVEEIAGRVVTSVGLPFHINQQEVYSGASIGIAYCHESDHSADELLRDADAAMYQAKNLGRGRFIVFDDTMHQRLLDDLAVDQDLHRAVLEGRFLPDYQGLYDIADDQKIGCEVGIDWQQGERDEIDGQRLRELAHSNGMITGIEQQVLRQVCRQMKPGGLLDDAVLVSIDLCGEHLAHAKSLQQLLDIVKAGKIKPGKLCFAFTEQSLLALESNNLELLKRIKRVGIGIALQGFGAGVSSLVLLAQNAIDYVRTDPAFTRALADNPGHQTLLHTLMALSQAFHFKVMLVGIDNEALRQLAGDYRVPIGQGGFFH